MIHRMDDIMARINSGWRVRWRDNCYEVYGPHGVSGLCPQAGGAIAYYMFQCELGPQTPYVKRLTMMDFLPLPKDDDVSVVAGDHEPTLYDGCPRGP